MLRLVLFSVFTFALVCGIHLENDLENFMQESELAEDTELLDGNDSDLDFGEEVDENKGDWRDSVRRVWGVNDVTAVSGQYFEYKIPKDAFTKGVDSYHVSKSLGLTSYLCHSVILSTIGCD